MPRLNIELNDDHRALIANLIESGQFHDAGEVVLEGLRLLEADRKPDSARCLRSSIADLCNLRIALPEFVNLSIRLDIKPFASANSVLASSLSRVRESISVWYSDSIDIYVSANFTTIFR